MLFERMLKAKKNLGLEKKLLDNMFEQANEEVVIGQDYIDECDYLDEKNLVEDILEPEIIPEPESPNDLDADKDVENTCNFSEEPVEKEFNSTLSVEELPTFSEPTISNQEIYNFYKNHPELVGRLYENGQFNPVLTKKDYELDKLWVDYLNGNVKIPAGYEEFLNYHDQYFKNVYKTKIEEWEKENKEYMNKVAEMLINHKKDFPYYDAQTATSKEMKEAFENLEKPTTEEKEESMDRVQEFESKVERPWEDTSGKTKSFVNDFLENYAEGNDLIQELRKDLMKIMSDFYWIKEGHHEHEPFALDFADALNELSVSI